MAGIELADLSFVVPCMGRLSHLQESLPRLLALARATCVVVDYGCPDASGDWVRQHCPTARVERAQAVTHFNLAAARNLGARAATTPWLCFVDADVLLAAGFAGQLSALGDSAAFYTALSATRGLSGTVLCTRATFERVGGYDDVMLGWGSEDTDFYLRLQMAGWRRASFDAATLHALPHADALRTRHYREGDARRSLSINAYYMHAKLDLMKLSGGALSTRARSALYARIAAQVGAALDRGEATIIDVPVGQQPLADGWDISATLRYRVAPRSEPAR